VLKSIRKWWNYIGTKLGMQLEASADPKVQLEQAITDAREQHRLLTEQAATVIANQKQLEFRLDRAIDEYQKAHASAGQALTLADQAQRAGNGEESARYEQAAEAFANRIIALERDIEELKQSVLAATQASTQARAAVNQNSAALQKKLAQRESLLSQLDQAKMQEQMNAAMSQLTAVAGEDGPTLDEVRTKIERRLATAQATSELTGVNVDASMLAVEQAQQHAEAQARLGEMRTQLGLLTPGDAAEPAITVSRAEQPAIGSGDDT
jgi:phage shock protein A